MASGKDRLLWQAPVIHRVGGQAVKRAGGSRRLSCQGVRRPSRGPMDPCYLFYWGARRMSHQDAAWERLRRHLQDHWSPHEGEERRYNPGDLSLSLCVYPLPSL
jgi:hypothetical protein